MRTSLCTRPFKRVLDQILILDQRSDGLSAVLSHQKMVCFASRKYLIAPLLCRSHACSYVYMHASSLLKPFW